MSDTPTPAPTDAPLPGTGGLQTASVTLCPYCGQESAEPDQCEACSGLFEPLSRQASQNAMGPWFIRDPANPFRPGCSYATLRMLVQKARVGPGSIIRGPSTRQFWAYARNTPGVAHLTGECHSCHRQARPDAVLCTQCGATFMIPDDRQYMGLAEVRLLPGQAPAAAVARSAAGRAAGVATPGPTDAGDLVEEEPPLQTAAYEPAVYERAPQAVEGPRGGYDAVEYQPPARGQRQADRQRTVILFLTVGAALAVIAVVLLAIIALSGGGGQGAGGAGAGAAPGVGTGGR